MANELVHVQSYDNFTVDHQWCDVIFTRPTFVIKLDAAVNMYHHFCDFVNLFASQFLNNTHFGRDNEVFWWDTHSGGFVDSSFGETWKAFSSSAPHELIDYAGKRICFKEAVFPLLARQILGPYYNMPLVEECMGSGLFHAFSHFITHRLQIEQLGPVEGRVRITLLDRKTKHRRIINIDELVESVNRLPGVEVRVVNYDYGSGGLSFREQLKATHNSDIFVGMHGSGLTHLLFLPDWAAIFEVYSCDDEHCYKDLARLRGVKYWTWRRDDKVFPQGVGLHPELGVPHKKFTDYAFDAGEFTRIVGQMVEYVRRHPLFVERQRLIHRKRKEQSAKKEEL